jgi:E3 ubiquitin-protein ligase DOA10
VAATLAGLTIPQAIAVASLIDERNIGARACLRDVLLNQLRAQFGTRGSAKADARKLAERLADPGEGTHAHVLRTVNALARNTAPLSVARIERILRNVERATA